MQEKYAESKKFTVVLSFAQQLDEEAQSFLQKSAPLIPAYDQLNPPGAPCGPGIPDSYLFDHTGKLVKRGHPAELYRLVSDLVEAVPDPIPPGILGDFVPRSLEAEARALEDPLLPVAEILERLEKLARGEDDVAVEAAELLAQVREWMPREVERLEKLAKKRPGFAAYDANLFASRFKGADKEVVSRAKALSKKLARDPYIKKFIRALGDLDRGRAAAGTEKGAQFVRRGRTALEKIRDDREAPSSIKREVREALKRAV